MRYGHLHNKPDVRKRSPKSQLLTAEKTTETSYTTDEISNGIKSLQNTFGLQVTGKINEDNSKLLKAQRFSMSDKFFRKQFELKLHHRNKRYEVYHQTTTGTYKIHKWPKKYITWQIYKPQNGSLSKAKQEEIFDKAFKIWEYVSPLRFVKSTANNGPWPDIDIEFHKGIVRYIFNKVYSASVCTYIDMLLRVFQNNLKQSRFVIVK